MDGREQPVAAEVQELDAVSPRTPRRKQLQRLCVVTAAMCLITAAALAATSDRGDGERPLEAMAGGAGDPETTTTFDRAEATTTMTVSDETTTTAPTTTTEEVLEGFEPEPPTTLPPAPLRLAAPETLAPYEDLSVRSVEPCPAGTDRVQVTAWAVGGTMDGWAVGGDTAEVDSDGHWSIDFGLAAVGGIDNVDAAMTAPELEVRAFCERGWFARDRVAVAHYLPVRVDHAHVTVVPELTGTWDGHTATIDFSGCPTSASAMLIVGDAPLEPVWEHAGFAASGRATPGSEPASWIATIELPGYDPSGGLWAYAFCTESSGVTVIWRSLAFELDPPG